MTAWHIRPGDRVWFTLYPSTVMHSETLSEVREPVPRTHPRVHAVEIGPHAIVDLLDVNKMED